MGEAISAALTEATELRQKIEERPANAKDDIDAKAALLARSERATENAQLVADGVVAAALSTAGESESRYIDRLVGTVESAIEVINGQAHPSVELTFRSMLEDWLTGARKQAIRPFHWPLEFPEVMARGGFDAIVGNPPFITGTMISRLVGRDSFHYMQRFIAGGRRSGGRADICSYFLLRDVDITRRGRVGIIATNTIAQGDSREIGLDQLTARGIDVYRAEKSRRWPGTAAVIISLIWIGHTIAGEEKYLDGKAVKAIGPSLEPRSRVSGNPHQLESNKGKAFVGSYVLGDGFLMPPQEAREKMERDPRTSDVLFPFLSGRDLNSSSDGTASRWIINFHDWPLERAQTYPEIMDIIVTTVLPERSKKDPVTYSGLMDHWWQYWRIRGDMIEAIGGLSRVLAMTLHTKMGMPMWCTSDQVFSHGLAVFATDRDAHLTLLSSIFHFAWWTVKGESTMKTDPRYTPSDGFETFAQPELTQRMDRVGVELHEFRRSVMLGRNLGLTKLYNRVHKDSDTEAEIVHLREIHIEVDKAVAEAYGWTDLTLRHGFYDTRQGRRFTIDPAVQVEILDRLLELNFERHAEEVKAGRHSTKRKSAKAAAQLVAEEGTLF